jgi:nucleoside-triphosphatase THEP1
MAIYHLHAGFVSRSTGRSSVQSVAYICGEKLHEDYRNQDVDYSGRGKDVALVKTLFPDNSRYKDISVWNELENFEDRYAAKYFKSEETCEKYKSSVQTAQTIVLALPNELSLKTNEELLDKFVNTRFTGRNLVSTYAIHEAEGNRHAHIQISRRAIGENGEFVSRKDREICTKSALLETRKLWADLTNEFLVKEGFKERITEKSFADLGINLEATKHRGWYADSIGTDSRIARENIEISRRNEEKILSDPGIIADYLNEKKAVFTQKDILNEIGKRVFEGGKISAIFEKVLEEVKYLGEGINGEFLYTGERYQQLESDVLSGFDVLSSQTAETACREETVSAVLSKYNHLSNEQKEAVVGLTGESNFGILAGKAGAGKTTTMKALSEIYEQNGSRVIGMSLSAVAAENLGKDAGIESRTIASWSHRWRLYETAQEKFLSFDSMVTDGVLKQSDWYRDLRRYEGSRLKSGDVIIVDEAGMAGTSDWKVILDAAEKFGAKVIAVGDDNQFKPISSGDCFRQFTDRNRKNIFELNEIRRQKEDWQREASIEFSKLNTGAALEKYERHGKLHASAYGAMHSAIAEKYLENEKAGSVAVLCATGAECTSINDKIRSLKKERGELGEDLLKINGRNFSENDRVIFLQNNKSSDLKNGQVGIVKFFENNILSVQTESGIKNIDIKEYDRLDHAYAITLHKSQGKTYDNTIVSASKMMDAKAFYVGMTRHRENVDLYYSKSDFGSFKALVNSASKYTCKDSAEDYRNIENQNKARVFEYKEMLLETASLLKDINCGEAGWKEYHALKKNSVSLGKEILGSYESHRLYLNQLGITKEKLEIGVGLKQRPLSNVELNAKSTVTLYAKTASEVRATFTEMKKSCFNITKHESYKKYCEMRELRNDLAKEILSNYPLHREFVRDVSREFFISKKTMENQVNYAERINVEKASELARAVLEKNDIFARLEAAKIDVIRKIRYEGSSVADCMIRDKNSYGYEERFKKQLAISGYAPYVSKSMMFAYCGKKSLSNSIHSGNFANEYAGILVQRKIEELGPEKLTLNIVEDAIKQALCFKALQEASGTPIFGNAPIIELHRQSLFLSEKITSENIHILKNKDFMKEIADVLKRADFSSQPSLSQRDIDRLASVNQADITSRLQNQKSAEPEKNPVKERSGDFEISR